MTAIVPSITEVDWSGCERRVIPADGADLACWHRPGTGDGWVIWLHGAAGNHLMWGHQIDAFADRHHLFLDLRGQGESALHAGRRVAFEDVVDDLGLVLDAHGVERAVIVGHSWGGNPAQEFSYRHPERTEALVMIGAWGQLRPMTDGELKRIRMMTKVYRVIPWGLVSRVNARACSNVPETRAVIAETVRATGHDVFLDLGLTAYEAVHDVDSYPAATPTLLLRGADDFPKALEPIYRAIQDKNPAAVEVVIPATRHMPMLDVPHEFNRAVGEFLDTLAT